MTTKPTLPQNDENREKRAWGLDEMKQMYSYEREMLAPLSIAARVPSREYFSPGYKGASDYQQMQFGLALAAGSAALGTQALGPLETYDRLLSGFRNGPVMRGDLMDVMFAQQRLAGVNPMSITRLSELPDDFPFTNAHLVQALGKGRTLAEECRAGRLYIVDYRSFESIPNGTREGGSKFLPAPLALFCWRETRFGRSGEMVPVAIHVRPSIEGEPVTLTPRSSPLQWRLAKLALQIADANHHEMSSHLCRTHFVMEPFAIATPRHLAWYHPVFILLRPHLRFMLTQNSYGREVLMSPGRVVDRLLAGSLDGSFMILAEAYDTWSFDQFSLPAELANRGLAKQEELPAFPYRDDAMLLWPAIRKYVESYLRLYYTSDPADVAADIELQAWAAELAAPQFGNVKGFPAKIDSVAQLTDALTTVLFTCGPQHAAINFPQFDFMAHVPNMPLASYAELPFEADSDLEVIQAVLPPRERTIEQLHVTYTLTSYRHDRLGHYLDGDFGDPRALEVIRQFRLDLYEAENTIQRRNESRLLPYPYLQPSLVPNSIAI